MKRKARAKAKTGNETRVIRARIVDWKYLEKLRREFEPVANVLERVISEHKVYKESQARVKERGAHKRRVVK